MPYLKTYDVFISHAWTYNDEYYRLLKMIREVPYLKTRDYSVPEHDPLLVKTDKGLDNALIRHIKPVNVVMVIAGMYVNYRRWIQREIEIAQLFNKPIIGIIPRGQQRTPLEVNVAATKMVGWDINSIVDAIRRYAI
jgi:hypothetical protein